MRINMRIRIVKKGIADCSLIETEILKLVKFKDNQRVTGLWKILY